MKDIVPTNFECNLGRKDLHMSETYIHETGKGGNWQYIIKLWVL
jgi:hypothetical protein